MILTGEVRQAWVSFFTLLATKEHQNAVKAIVKIAQDDEDIDLRIQAIESLTSLVKSSEKVREIVIKDTSTYLDSVGWASDQSDRIKVAWTNLKLQTILLSKSERNFIPNFVEAITQDLSLSIKEIITVTLVNLYVGDIDANQATIMDSLTGRIELGLRNQDVDIRNRSILAIGLISQAIAVREIQKDDFREREATANFVKGISGKLLPPLLRIITNEEGDIFTAAENAFEGIKAASENRHLYYYDGATVSRSSLSAIPQVLELITDKGKDFVIRFVQTLQTDIYRFRTVNDVTVSVVRKIVNALSRTRRPSHAAALELLIHFHQNDSCVRVIHSAIPEIISIALSRDTAEKVRILALDLIYLASSDDDDNNNLNEIIQRQHEFMLLLENAKHSHRAAKVLSIMAKNKDVRKDILSQIISHCIREDIKTHKGYITLIFQLLIDGRFKEEPTDYIMIILASTLVKRPKLAHLRFPVVSALWCYYYKILKEKTKADLPSDLAKWFTVALFGRHITSYEVRTWNTMGAGWLQNAQTNENTGEEHQVSNERPEIRISEP
ncbi:hypothetical protein BDQ17DRAFT_154606 [Cyathus striatus]|nr:hypothetical protein BDQ17DRAFT_154606 [Cyathus striatus]